MCQISKRDSVCVCAERRRCSLFAFCCHRPRSICNTFNKIAGTFKFIYAIPSTAVSGTVFSKMFVHFAQFAFRQCFFSNFKGVRSVFWKHCAFTASVAPLCATNKFQNYYNPCSTSWPICRIKI